MDDLRLPKWSVWLAAFVAGSVLGLVLEFGSKDLRAGFLINTVSSLFAFCMVLVLGAPLLAYARKQMTIGYEKAVRTALVGLNRIWADRTSDQPFSVTESNVEEIKRLLVALLDKPRPKEAEAFHYYAFVMLLWAMNFDEDSGSGPIIAEHLEGLIKTGQKLCDQLAVVKYF